MKSLVPTYVAPRADAPVTGDVLLDIPDASAPIQTLWCEGLAIARLDIHEHGFMMLHLRGATPLQISVCVRNVPDVADQLLAFACSGKKRGRGRING